MHPDKKVFTPPSTRPSYANSPKRGFVTSPNALVFTKAQRKALADLPGSVDYSVETTNIRGAIAAVPVTGSRSSVVMVIAGNGKVTEF